MAWWSSGDDEFRPWDPDVFFWSCCSIRAKLVKLTVYVDIVNFTIFINACNFIFTLDTKLSQIQLQWNTSSIFLEKQGTVFHAEACFLLDRFISSFMANGTLNQGSQRCCAKRVFCLFCWKAKVPFKAADWGEEVVLAFQDLVKLQLC